MQRHTEFRFLSRLCRYDLAEIERTKPISLSLCMYGYVWLCMAVYGGVWLCMPVYGGVWLCRAMYGYVWLCMAM